MKKIISIFLACFTFASHGLFSQDEIFYTDEDPEIFNRGRFVGEANNDYLRAIRLQRTKNWAIAIGSTIIGGTTAYFVRQHHVDQKNKENQNRRMEKNQQAHAQAQAAAS